MTGESWVSAAAGGVVIDVRVMPRASRAGIAGTRDGALLVRLNAPPVDGAANAELVAVLAKALGLAPRAVRIIRGERGRRKRVHVEGVNVETVRTLLN